jgi:hypothetical protein
VISPLNFVALLVEIEREHAAVGEFSVAPANGRSACKYPLRLISSYVATIDRRIV